jgi:hypothetical protein
METTEKTIKNEVNVLGNLIELTTINHNVFGDVYFIYVNGQIQHSQYGTKRLDVIYNEFLSEKFDLVYS